MISAVDGERGPDGAAGHPTPAEARLIGVIVYDWDVPGAVVHGLHMTHLRAAKLLRIVGLVNGLFRDEVVERNLWLSEKHADLRATPSVLLSSGKTEDLDRLLNFVERAAGL